MSEAESSSKYGNLFIGQSLTTGGATNLLLWQLFCAKTSDCTYCTPSTIFDSLPTLVFLKGRKFALSTDDARKKSLEKSRRVSTKRRKTEFGSLFAENAILGLSETLFNVMPEGRIAQPEGLFLDGRDDSAESPQPINQRQSC